MSGRCLVCLSVSARPGFRVVGRLVVSSSRSRGYHIEQGRVRKEKGIYGIAVNKYKEMKPSRNIHSCSTRGSEVVFGRDKCRHGEASRYRLPSPVDGSSTPDTFLPLRSTRNYSSSLPKKGPWISYCIGQRTSAISNTPKCEGKSSNCLPHTVRCCSRMW